MIRLKNRFGKANRKEMSWMSDLMETLRQEGISPDLLRAVEDYRAAHALPEALRPRIPASGFPCLLIPDLCLRLISIRADSLFQEAGTIIAAFFTACL